MSEPEAKQGSVGPNMRKSLEYAHRSGRLREEVGTLRQEIERLKGENKDLRDDLGRKDVEIGELKSSSDQNKLLKDNKTLLEQIRGLKNRTVIDGVLRDEKIRPEAVEAFHRLAPYEADGDEPDAEAIRAWVAGRKAEFGYLFGAGDGQPEFERRPAPGRGQGARDGGSNRVKATKDQLGDPDWAWANRGALREKRVDLID